MTYLQPIILRLVHRHQQPADELQVQVWASRPDAHQTRPIILEVIEFDSTPRARLQ